MAAAGQVARVVRLQSIELAKVTLRNRLVPSEKTQTVQVAIDTIVGKHQMLSPRLLAVVAGGKVSFYPEQQPEAAEGDEGVEVEPVAEIVVEFNLYYTTPPPPVPQDIEEGGIPAFARINPLYNCWPYVRQKIHSLSAELGIPVVAPLLMVEAVKEQTEPEQHPANDNNQSKVE